MYHIVIFQGNIMLDLIFVAADKKKKIFKEVAI